MKGDECYSEEFGKKNVCRVERIRTVKKGEDHSDYNGEFIGILKLSERGSEIFHRELDLLEKENLEFLRTASLNDFFGYLIDKGIPIFLEYFRGRWKDIDSIEDLTYLINLFSKE